MNTNRMLGRTRTIWVAAALAAGFGCRTSPKLATFETPDQAMHALADVVGTHDADRVDELSAKAASSCSDRATRSPTRGRRARPGGYPREARLRGPLRRHEGGPDRQRRLAVPIPLVQKDGRWHFDAVAGADELANRRIGRNELSTIATLHECVDAQREYVGVGHDGRPPPSRAR